MLCATFPRGQSRVEIYVESPDPKVVDSLDKILKLPTDELKSSLILPFSVQAFPIRKQDELKPVRL